MSTSPPPADADPGGRRRSGQLESQIVTVLIEAGTALTPGEVRDRLEPASLAYSTVVTTLTRLHDKGAVRRERVGRAYRYGAVQDAAGLVAERMSRILAAESDHTSVLRRFVGGLDRRDEEILRDLLREQPES
ncbi:putative transcriptional regulator [Allocatelliglobosispora scoriae]|uniref:Putative transcriptional regulator n=1 Tax=Allocatelliglobosispora scoriae TaxID=643052 RepID=A0A841C1X5_9ACTN|nr:BlaI/MecI/CopY family transcriptional regulator [Allocatelliglobosispora scoriae]MBB5874354.1 putative transcriptional regulator [Allocatelliglobosispora scoriae]